MKALKCVFLSIALFGLAAPHVIIPKWMTYTSLRDGVSLWSYDYIFVVGEQRLLPQARWGLLKTSPLPFPWKGNSFIFQKTFPEKSF